jgi:hypothetical protein
MKKQTINSVAIDANQQIIDVVKEQILLEPTKRFELFKAQFLDNNYTIDITFDTHNAVDKHYDLLMKCLDNNISITDFGGIPVELVVCTVLMKQGNEVVFSATADAPMDFSSPYKAAETMALNRLFDRLGIDSILHENELKVVNRLQSQIGPDSTSTALTKEDMSFDIADIPTRDELQKQESAQVEKFENTQVSVAKVSTTVEESTIKSNEVIESQDDVIELGNTNIPILEELIETIESQDEIVKVDDSAVITSDIKDENDESKDDVIESNIIDTLELEELIETIESKDEVVEVDNSKAITALDKMIETIKSKDEVVDVDLSDVAQLDAIEQSIHSKDEEIALNATNESVITGDLFSENSVELTEINQEPTVVPMFPADLPPSLQTALTSRLQVAHGNDWEKYIPTTKNEAYVVLDIPVRG